MKYKIKNFRTIIDANEIEINLGEILVLIGQNGSGKSNILSCINYFSNKSDLIEDDLPKLTEYVENYNEIYEKTRNLEINFSRSLSNQEVEEIQELLKSVDYDNNE